MTVVGSRNLTLADAAKRTDPQGRVSDIAEVLNEDHQILDDAVFQECNDGSSHKNTQRNGIPEPTWRKLYGGVQSTKSSTEQVVDSCGMLEALPMIDVDVVDKSTDPKGTLFSENIPHIEGMKQTMEKTLFYGDTRAHAERYMGLHPRFNSYCRADPDDKFSDYNVISAGGSGADNTSIWLITWSDQHCHFLFPRGSQAGLKQENKGKLLVDAGDGSGKYEAYVTKYKWDLGLCVKNWRGVGRICNIDMSALESDTGAADLVRLMVILSERVEGNGRKAWYMSKRVRTALRLQMLNKNNVHLSYENVEGRPVLHFDGIPVRHSKKILHTEDALSQATE